MQRNYNLHALLGRMQNCTAREKQSALPPRLKIDTDPEISLLAVSKRAENRGSHIDVHLHPRQPNSQ